MSDSDFIEFECPECRQDMRVAAKKAGKRIRCPECGETIAVPLETGMTSAPLKSSRRSKAEDYDERDREDYDDEDDDDMPVRRSKSTGMGVLAPAIIMLVIAVLGLLVDLFGSAFALLGPEAQVNPQDPPLVQQIARGTRGPLASMMQGTFALLSAVTIVGSIQMMRQKTWGLALTASIISMVNVGNCCCLLGLPIGIWAMIMLLNPEVKDGFS